MFHSAESRWFFEGELPDRVRAWFVSACTARAEPKRTDDYLLLPGCTTTGVKIRAGNFEIKVMTRGSEPVTYASRVECYRDAWVKWSCEAEDVDALRRMLGTTGDRWASVRKSRRLRLFSAVPTPVTCIHLHREQTSRPPSPSTRSTTAPSASRAAAASASADAKST